jgi:hypothetical protein
MTGPAVFVDGNHNTPGCGCNGACEFPCWQRAGLTQHGCRDGHKPCPPLPTTFDEDGNVAA